MTSYVVVLVKRSSQRSVMAPLLVTVMFFCGSLNLARAAAPSSWTK